MPSFAVPSAAFAILAAVAGAVSTVCLAGVARRSGVRATAALTGVIGVVIGPCSALVLHGLPSADASAWAWATAAGALSLVGNGLFLASSRRLDLALTAPIVASAGAVAALMSAASGASWGAGSILGGILLTTGVVLTARGSSTGTGAGTDRNSTAGVLLATCSALALGGSYVAIGQTERAMGAGWGYVVLMALMFSVWTIPAWSSRTFHMPSRAVLSTVVAAEVAGICVFVFLGRASAEDPVLSSLIYSQYSVLAGGLGLLIWRERPVPTGLVGAVLTIAGTALVLLAA